jgi:hypothetical protein
MKMLDRAMRSPPTIRKTYARLSVVAAVRANNGEGAPTLPRIGHNLKNYIRGLIILSQKYVS